MNFTETVRTVDGETHEDDVGVRVGERTETIVIFLSCRVPQRQLHLHAHTHTKRVSRIGVQVLKNLTLKVHALFTKNLTGCNHDNALPSPS